jgi:hypothetical protein
MWKCEKCGAENDVYTDCHNCGAIKAPSVKPKHELTFVLQQGESVICEAERCQYAGVAYVTQPSGLAVTLESGWTVGSLSVQTHKREGSVSDARGARVYLTNCRLVFCTAKISLFGGQEKELGTPFSEIPLANIRGSTKGSKFGNPTIDLAVLGERGGIDNIKFWFPGKREAERDQFYAAVREVADSWERASKSTSPAAIGTTLRASPLDELKKLAELRDLGVVTPAEFEAKKKQLLGL